MVREPTDSQWAAVRAVDEHVLVEAGAGTGKTTTVVARILYLLGVAMRGQRIATPVALDDIVAITFTRQAAADLKRDLRTALRERGRRAEAYAVDHAHIGTIHGFCADLVRDHALRSGRAPIGGVLEEGEALAWAEGCVRDELVEALETQSIAGLDALLGAWDVKKVEAWTLKLLGASDRLHALRDVEHSPEELALLELAGRSLRRLEARLDAEHVIDYDRMIGWTRDLLRDNDSVRGMLQRRCQDKPSNPVTTGDHQARAVRGVPSNSCGIPACVSTGHFHPTAGRVPGRNSRYRECAVPC
jgi:superfamily I DNA/RNA helicase